MGVNGATERLRAGVPGSGPRFDPGHARQKPVKVATPRCPFCGETGIVTLSWGEWQHWITHPQMTIQEALPRQSADVREQLLNGTHPRCWASVMGDEP